MFDFDFLISIIISVFALLISLYREFTGPDISLLTKEPTFQLTDRSFSVSDEYIPEWFSLSEVSLVFANYGRKGGTILDVKIDFTPIETFKEFYQDFNFYFSEAPITIKDGENSTMKFRPSIRTINWKKFALMKMLQDGQNIGESVDKAIAEGKEKFRQFCSFLSENEELGEVSCTISLTVGRFRTKVKDKKFFEKIKVENEYGETIDLLRKRLQNWDNLKPTRAELINEIFRVPNDLISELKANLHILEIEIDEKNITQSKLQDSSWSNLSRARNDEIRWFLIDRERNLRSDLESLYKQISNYNSGIQELLYLGERRTKTDFKNLNEKRAILYKVLDEMLQKLKGLV